MRTRLIITAIMVFFTSGCSNREIFISESHFVKIQVKEPAMMVPVIQSILERWGGIVTNTYIPYYSSSSLDYGRIDASLPTDNVEKALNEIYEENVEVIDVRSTRSDKTSAVLADRERYQELSAAEEALLDRMENPEASIAMILALRDQLEAIREEMNNLYRREGVVSSKEPRSTINFEIYSSTLSE